MRHTLKNAYHDDLKTTITLTPYQEMKREEMGETVWDYISRTDPGRAARILKRLDDSQPEAIIEG